MEDFKFLNNTIDKNLVEYINENSFTILFLTTQYESVSFREKNILTIHDLGNDFRMMNVVLINYYNNIYTYIIFNGNFYIKLKIKKIPNVDSFDILYCKKWMMTDVELNNIVLSFTRSNIQHLS